MAGKTASPIEVSKRFKRQKFQNIIPSVADSGVIEKITLKSVIIYNLHLCWMSARSAILKILETTWVSVLIETRRPLFR